MELCQNNSKTVESIKEARAICTHTTLDAKALSSATVKEAKATCAQTVWEAETLCSTAIRDKRPGEPSRLTHSTRDMPRPSNTWRNKSSKRKAKVRLTSSLLSSCLTSQPYRTQGCNGSFLSPVDGTSTYIPPIHLITRSPPLSNHLLQQLLLPWHLSILPGLRGNTPPQTQWMT